MHQLIDARQGGWNGDQRNRIEALKLTWMQTNVDTFLAVDVFDQELYPTVTVINIANPLWVEGGIKWGDIKISHLDK